MNRSGVLLAALFCMAAVWIACNPFAPKLDENGGAKQFGDPHTVPGFFDAFKYAYQFRDTSLYSSLLANDFTFSYRNYDRGVDVQWGRDDDMRSTAGLFNAAQSIVLLWGSSFDSSGSATTFDITLPFSLDVTFNPSDIEHVDGRAVFHLTRSSPSDIWKAETWVDQSNL